MVTALARRRPAKVAKETATLDRLSHGRLTFGVGLGSDRLGEEFSLTGEELDERRRARMLDESLQILTAAWSGEVVTHRGEFFGIAGMRFMPTPIQHPRVPVWVAATYGNRRPLERAAHYDGLFPVNLEHPDQLAEMAAYVDSLRQSSGHDTDEPYDLVVSLAPGVDPRPYADVGATWWLVEIPWQEPSFDLVRGVIRDGPVI